MFLSSLLALQIFPAGAGRRRLHNLGPGGVGDLVLLVHQVQVGLLAGLGEVLDGGEGRRTGLHTALQSSRLTDVVVSVSSQGGEGLVDEVKVGTRDVIVVL